MRQPRSVPRLQVNTCPGATVTAFSVCEPCLLSSCLRVEPSSNLVGCAQTDASKATCRCIALMRASITAHFGGGSCIT